MRNQNRIDPLLSPSAEKAARRRGRRKSPFSAATLAASLLAAWGILFAQASFAQGGGTVSNVRVTGTTASLQFSWVFTPGGTLPDGTSHSGFGLCAVPAPSDGMPPTLTDRTQCHGGSETFTAVGTTSGNIIDLPAGSYYPAVRAHDDGGETSPFATPSPWVAIQVGTVVELPTVAKPSNLQPIAGNKTITVTWDWIATGDPLVQASEFEVCAIADTGSAPDFTTLTLADCVDGGQAISYTPPGDGTTPVQYDGSDIITGLANGTAYYVAVRALAAEDEHQDSAWAGVDNAVTPAGICGGFTEEVEGLCALDNDDSIMTSTLGYNSGNRNWHDYGQVFTAGDNDGGYTLSSIAVELSEVNSPTGPIEVEIRNVNVDESTPGETILFDNFDEQTPSAAGIVRFTPNSDFTFDPGTRYAVVVHARATANDRDSGYFITFKNPAGTTGWAGGSAGSRTSRENTGSGSFEPLGTFQLPVEIRAAVVGAEAGLRLKLRVFLESALP